MHSHPLPEVDKDYCSCCRKAIIHGYENVVQITMKPEGIYNLAGELQGTKGEERLKAVYHASCFQEGHVAVKEGTPSARIECSYCGIFSMAKKLKDGTLNSCKCCCHEGKSVCSLLIL